MISFLSPNNSNASGGRDIVSTREGKALATSLEVSYAECSSLTNDGVQQALNKATELAINFINQEKSVTSKALGFFKRSSKNSCSVKDQEPLPPELPPAGNRLTKLFLSIGLSSGVMATVLSSRSSSLYMSEP